MICCVLTGLSCAWTVEEPANRRQMEDLVRSVTTGIVLGTRDLPWCAPGRLEDGFGFWCSLRPDVVICAFCFGAAQAVAAAEDSVAACAGGPAPDKDHDATIAAKPEPWLGVCFFLCAQCCPSERWGPC